MNYAGDQTGRSKQKRASVLTYHAIESDDLPSTYTLSRAQLEEHLRLLDELGKNRLLPSGGGLFTFDDGYSSDYKHAAPLLEKHGRRGVFFLVASLVGSSARYMNWSEAKELANRGHEIQSHSWSHPLLTQCSDGELGKELAQSKRELEDRLGTEVDAVSAPGGRWNDRVIHSAHSAGYRRFFVSDPFIGCQEHSGMQLWGRITVKRTMTTNEISGLLRGTGLYPMIFQGLFKSRELLRQLTGDRIYTHLWKAIVNR